MNDIDISIYFNVDRLKAVQHILSGRGETVENYLADRLMDLYLEIVPTAQQKEIENTVCTMIKKEQEAKEAKRRVTAFKIVQDGQASYYEADCGIGFLDAARILRLDLQQNMDILTALRCYSLNEISETSYQNLIQLRLDNLGKVSGVYEYDFDAGQMNALHIMDGWKCFRMRDVSTAVFHADRSEYRKTEERLSIFFDKIQGKELSPDSAFVESEKTADESEDQGMQIQTL